MTDENQAAPPTPPVSQEERQQLEALIESTFESGSYLVAIFQVTPERKVRLDRVSRSFPMVDFDSCVGLLKQDLDGEKAGAVTQRDAMTEAVPIAPVVDLFGTPPGGAQ
jgi:hypothetical protein